MVLKRVRVIATRPAKQNTTWCERLEQAGYPSINAPALKIETLPESEIELNPIFQLADYYAMIFVSQNAVRAGFELLDKYWPQLPYHLKFFGIGKATCAAINIELEGFNFAGRAISTAEEQTSEALLKLPELREIYEKKILIVRGVGGRPKLAQELIKRSAKVELCELYRRVPLDISNILSAELSCEDPESTLISVFSGETLNAISVSLESLDITLRTKIPVVLPGERLHYMGSKMGFGRIVKAENASEESMLLAIKKHSARHE